MKIQNYLTQTLSLVAACALFGAATSQAAIFHVEIDTASLLDLPASAEGPFSLNFQLNNSSGGSETNSVSLTNFTFGGGSATGSADILGTGTGDLGSSITLSSSASSPFNDFLQGFIPGSTFGFDVSISENINSFSPDLFSVAILDGNFQNIPTTGLGNSLVILELDGTPTPEFFSGTGDFAEVVAAPVPEPGTAIWGAGLGLAFAFRRARSRRA